MKKQTKYIHIDLLSCCYEYYSQT